MWLEIAKWAFITLAPPFALFLLVRFYQELKPPRGEEWHQLVDRDLRALGQIIQRLTEVEIHLKVLEKDVLAGKIFAAEERRQILDSISDLHEKLDRLMERLLDAKASRA